MNEEDMERQIICEIPPTYWDVDPNSGVMSPQATTVSFSGGWTLVPGLTTAIFFSGSIDLSGYAMDDLTFSPYASFLQEGGFTFFRDGSGAYVVDIVSSVPIDPRAVTNSAILGALPGFTQVTAQTGLTQAADNPDTIMHAQFRFMGNDSSYPGNFFLTPELETFGSSLEPTAADKLYYLRVAVILETVNAAPPQTNYGSQFSLPAARIKIPGRWSREPDLEYMMRLKRSYELANQV